MNDNSYTYMSKTTPKETSTEAKLRPMRTFVLRVTTFLLVSALILSLAALVTYSQGSPINTDGVYTASLSAIITFVAAYHYRAIVKVRTNKDGAAMSSRDEELEVDGLRHSDWLVTLPLLVLKLYHVINNPNKDLFFNNAELSALMSMLMILLGAIARLALDWGLPFSQMGDVQRVFVCLCYLVSTVLLVVLLIDLGNATSGSDAASIIWSFFLLWIGYPIVAIGSFFARSSVDSNSAWLSFFKDVTYACLDTWSKAVFAWWTASRCFGIHFLGQ